MFTGIIESLGVVTAVDVRDDGGFARITIDAGAIVADLPRGGSLAVDGVCLTAVPDDEAADAAAGTGPATGDEATGAAAGVFTADVMGETLARTSLGALAPGSRVNLERCMPAGGRFDGHVVQGHVDGVGTVSARSDEGGWVRLRVDIPAELARYTAEKGSIALGGASLTLTAVSPAGASPAWVEVGLIPATLEHTVFGTAEVGDPVNIEVDVLAKYAERLLSFRNAVSEPQQSSQPQQPSQALPASAPHPAATPRTETVPPAPTTGTQS